MYTRDMEEREARLRRLDIIFYRLIGKHIDMHSFKDRLILQKLVYLLKSAKLNFNYSFSWYLRGPYSSGLANDGYEASNMPKQGEKITNISLSGEEERKVSRFSEVFSSDLRDSDKIELYAAVLYFLNCNHPANIVAEKVKTLKPWYSEKEISDALHKINGSKLFSIAVSN